MCLLQQYQTLIVGAAGFTGVIVTLMTNAWLARAQHRRQVQHERTVLRVALRAELEAVAESYRDRIELIGSPGRHDGLLYPLDTMSQVYKSMIGRIGLLTAIEVKAVLQAYLLIEQLPDRVKILASSDRKTEPGFVHIAASNFGPVQKMHENYLTDVDAALAAIPP
ncbi:MAG TPA: hypothetical protein VFA39_16510 [Steroidobacteraceae bacterium]|nr:hypothetical protein [Steroidobacteraceae bacterium]